ncbi:MAG: peptidase S41, partial [Pseudomonadota bacterium]|nr:peptidase S41 [Pseudomonadota bacterium]
MAAAAPTDRSETYRQLNLFGDVFERVRANYVDQIDVKDLIEAAINGMLTSLDPHSSYLNAESFQDMQVQTRGEFGGLGIEVTMEGGLIKVVSPI